MSAETDDEMDLNDFYNDRKFCTECAEYVTYLQSMEHSYCTQCGSQVRLFSSGLTTGTNRPRQPGRQPNDLA